MPADVRRPDAVTGWTVYRLRRDSPSPRAACSPAQRGPPTWAACAIMCSPVLSAPINGSN